MQALTEALRLDDARSAAQAALQSTATHARGIVVNGNPWTAYAIIGAFAIGGILLAWALGASASSRD